MDPLQSHGPSAQNVQITHFSDSRFQILDLLGAGAYGIVVSARNTFSGDQVAIKKIQKAFDSSVYAKRTLRELKILRLMEHPNILDITTIQLPCSLKSMTDLYVISPLMQTDLGQIIKGPSNLTDQHFQFFMYQLLRGLQHIHSAGIVHRDLKPRNLLVNSNCDLKIADFGLARPILNGSLQRKQAMTDYVSTRWYRAPELLLETKNYSEAMDVWSAGMIFGELLIRKPVVPGTSSVHQLELVFKLIGTPSIMKKSGLKMKRTFREVQKLPSFTGNFQEVFEGCNPIAVDLLKKMLVVQPGNRISTGEALEHPYFDELREADDQNLAERYSMYDFEFQLMKLKMEDLKKLIYDEILLYHSEERLQAYQRAKSEYVNSQI